jgi:hypothetical protein
MSQVFVIVEVSGTGNRKALTNPEELAGYPLVFLKFWEIPLHLSDTETLPFRLGLQLRRDPFDNLSIRAARRVVVLG